ncbi:TusE/DsrC/DsvC family sulfur relay protein [Candidatus Photodesmus blepharus]|uniref:TusE/DsrC/DsvC family sulfur relay protein n=1 Tax=Candidatus Photodesmus blepharonis TaxID=1179155 RepID=UPI000553232D
MIDYKNQKIRVDLDGYLVDSDRWEPGIVEVIAKKENICLTESHLEIIYFVRDFYQTFSTSPPLRILVKAIEKKYGLEKGNSKYLFKLFPKGPAKQATKLAGLPKPVKCL